MKRLARIAAGYTLVTAGTVMIFVPGPGLITIVGGLALLQDDVKWAGKATDWLKQRAGRSDEGGRSTHEGG
ncbi:MAG TPA: PGPGW domain-containing protein [Acidimicrobiia bacterium]|nr:PGPGW domain-containing protein [Acidimicrobiia bacterium]